MSDSVQLIHAAQAINLTPGWSSATIEGLVGGKGVFVDGDWVESKDQDPTGDVRLIQLADIGDGEYRNKSDRFLTQEKALELGCTFLMKDDVLIARMPDPLGRACIFPGDRKKSVTVVDVAIVRSGKAEFNHRWLMYFINAPAFRTSVASLQSGSTRKRISRGNLSRILLPVPPRGQQDRIVAEIEKQFSRLDEAVSNLKRVKTNLKRYKTAVLKAAVDGKLAPTAGPWKQVALGDVTTSIRNGYSKKPDAEQGTRIFRISAVRPLKLDANDVRYLSGTPADYEPFLVEPGDVLFTRYNGNRDYVGVCARVPANLPPTVYPDKLIRVRVPRLMMLPEFLVILASTGRAREYIESKIRTTAGQSGISGGDLKVLPLDIPRVAEQLQIVAEVERRLSVIEELEAAVQANRTRADRLRQSILGQAFSGKLLLNETRG